MAKNDIQEEKSCAHDDTAVYQAAQGAAAGLEGQLLKEDNGAGTMTVKFDKKIHGKVLGDRMQLRVAIRAAADGGSTVTVEAYPIDAVGRKLMFGARKGVMRTVLDWYWAHLVHRLPAARRRLRLLLRDGRWRDGRWKNGRFPAILCKI